MQDILFIWIIIAMILFALAVTATPSDDIDHSGVFWLAILAIAWPLILLLTVLGIVLTFAANVLRSWWR